MLQIMYYVNFNKRLTEKKIKEKKNNKKIQIQF